MGIYNLCGPIKLYTRLHKTHFSFYWYSIGPCSIAICFVGGSTNSIYSSCGPIKLYALICKAHIIFYVCAIGSYGIAIFFHWGFINSHPWFSVAYKIIDPDSQHPFKFYLYASGHKETASRPKWNQKEPQADPKGTQADPKRTKRSSKPTPKGTPRNPKTGVSLRLFLFLHTRSREHVSFFLGAFTRKPRFRLDCFQFSDSRALLQCAN